MKNILTLFIMLFTSTVVFAEEAAQPTGGGYMQSLIMILLAIVFFYFILWRPEQKRKKAQMNQRNALKAGDKVTAMGILGTVDSVTDNTIILKTVDGSKIEMLKLAVTNIENSDINAKSCKK